MDFVIIRAMFTPVEAFLGWRYTRAKRRNHFVSFISAIAMLGVALGIAALITILSIMNGFESELRDRILGMAAHIVVTAERGPIKNWQNLAGTTASQAGVSAVAPYVQREAMLTYFDNVQGVVVRGIDPAVEASVSIVAQKVVSGSIADLIPGRFNIVLGNGLAHTLQARVGSVLTLIAPEPVRTPAGMVPRVRRFHVVGIFEAGVHEYDTTTALVHISDAAKMFRYGKGITGIRLKVADPFAAPQIGTELTQTLSALGEDAIVTDWTETNVNLFKALKTEKIVMFIILALTIAVAAFNLVSTLVMVVGEKRTEIAVLQTIGLTRNRILLTFFIYGGLIGGIGIVLGTAIGVGLSLNVDSIVVFFEQLLHTKIFDPSVYYISKVPSQLERDDVIVAVIVAIGLCILAPIYPALMASRTAPARALRYD